MKPQFLRLAVLLALSSGGAFAATLYVAQNNPNPAYPYSDWSTAATNIQDAIDAASSGDLVLVTNGVYRFGGKSMDGIITNRVSLDKALLVQSVNGAAVTTIQGAWDAQTNGPAAVRCAWLTTNAILNGFTLTQGGTRRDMFSDAEYGGGVFGVAGRNGGHSVQSAIVSNCTITNNAADGGGGGAYFVNLINCLVINNVVFHLYSSINGEDGGGARSCNLTNCIVTGNYTDGKGGGTVGGYLKNCAITRNSAGQTVGGAYGGTLMNCTVTENLGIGTTYDYAGGVYQASLTNCIVYGNQEVQLPSSAGSNYSSCTFGYSCSAPLPAGTGNIGFDPRLLADALHLSAVSPCIGAGTSNVASGTDIDGKPWASPPSMGCDDWQPAPLIATKPRVQVDLPAHGLNLNVLAAGQTPLSFFWYKDGSLLHDDGHFSSSGTANLVANRFGPDDAGAYQLVVSNALGMVTSQVAQVVIHTVSLTCTNPISPYSTWATAAGTVQDAIDVSANGDIVLVSNGVYSAGGKVMAGNLTNRVALNKPITVTSVNGFAVTAIQGAWDPASENGPNSVRCAWLADGALLSGFTLQNGASGSYDGSFGAPQSSGGGVWCVSTNGIVANCLLSNNIAYHGGGVAYGTLKNCLVVKNQATYGGGSFIAALFNCSVAFNYTTVYSDDSRRYVAGAYSGVARNSLICFNYANAGYGSLDNYGPSGVGPGSPNFSYCCTDPALPGSGNIDAFPALMDWFHVDSNSPCRGAGSSLFAAGFDLDGEPWLNPPSIGCDEVVMSNLTGPLSVSLTAWQTSYLVGHYASFTGYMTGRVASVTWSFGDGPAITNLGAGPAHLWTSAGDYPVTFTAYNLDNPSGVSASTNAHVVPVNQPQLQSKLISNNAFGFQFVGQAGAYYTVQYSTNLLPPITWNTLQYLYPYPSTGGVYQVLDPLLNNQARYYRLRAQ